MRARRSKHISLFVGFQRLDIFPHGWLRLPADLFLDARRVDNGLHAIALALREHHYLVAKHLRDLKDRVGFRRADAILVALPFLADHETRPRDVLDVRKIPFLHTGRNDRNRLAPGVLFLESADYARVRTFGEFAP